MESGLVDQVSPGSTSLHCFDCEFGVPPVNFWSGSQPVTHPLHVVLEWVYYSDLPPQLFHLLPVSGYC